METDLNLEEAVPMIQLRAMIVDDSRVMRSMVTQALEKAMLADFAFIEAGTGSEALEKFDADLLDIIFVDWNMPGMNGIEFAREVRSMPWAKHIPIVMITSETGTDKQQNAYEKARITCYVTKPFTVEELQEKIGPVIADLAKKREKTTTTPTLSPPPTAVKQGGFFSKLMS
jgi:two-component system chemotaxis response regulator CheY